MGFEPSVSPKIDRAFEIALSPLRHSRSARETGSFCERDRRFESASLHRGVNCEPFRAAGCRPRRASVEAVARVYQERVEDLSFIWSTSGWIYLREFLHVILHLGLVLWPLTWGTVRGLSLRALTWATGIMAILCGLYLWHQGELPQPLGPILTWNELGMGRRLIAGSIPDRPWLVWGQGLVLAISLSGAVVLVAALVERLWRWKHWIRDPATVLLFNGLGQLMFLEVLWLFYDRYYLPLLPGSTALLASYLKPTKGVTALILAGGLLWGAIAITGTIDMFRFSVSVASARSWLLRQGVAAGSMGEGYVLNGWWLYAPGLPSGRGPEPDVPFVTTMRSLPYKIANAPVPGYAVVRRVAWPALCVDSDTLHIFDLHVLIAQLSLPLIAPRDN